MDPSGTSMLRRSTVGWGRLPLASIWIVDAEMIGWLGASAGERSDGRWIWRLEIGWWREAQRLEDEGLSKLIQFSASIQRWTRSLREIHAGFSLTFIGRAT